MSGTALYTPSVPANNRFSLLDTNALASNYAAQYGHGGTAHIAEVIRSIIYDAAPKQFLDLNILNQKTPVRKDSDEFKYHEMGYGRDPILNANIAAPIASASTQTIPIQNLEAAALDMIVIYSDNSRGTITAINAGAGTISVTAETGRVLPAIPISVPGAFVLANHSPVEADGMDTIKQYFRQDTVERFNYIQLLIKAQRWGAVEIEKYMRSGSSTGKAYVQANRQKMLEQFRIDLSNVYWNGNLGEVTLSGGEKAKTAQGIFPTMQQAGSPNTTVTLANSPQALEELVFETEFGSYGSTKFLYGTNRALYRISQQYKRDLTRYTPNDMVAKLNLSSIDMGSTKVVFVPMERFRDRASFPDAFRKRVILLDQESVTPCYFMPEEMGDTLSRGKSGSYRNFVDNWISASFSIEFNNPLASGYLDISNLS